MESSKPIFIYVHGLYGCYLAKEKQSLISSIFTTGFNLPWSILKSYVLLKPGHTDLKLPITWSPSPEDKNIMVQDKDDFVPSDDFLLSHSELIKFMDTLNDEGLIQLHKIRWDWRRSLEENEKNVSSELIHICSNAPDKVTIMTHSTGAVLSWPTINKHPEWFHTWINVAGAIAGSNIMLHEFQYSWKTPGLDFLTLLSKEVLFTCPSQYGFFRVVPEETFRGDAESEFIAVEGGNGGEKHFVLNDQIDLYNIDHWERFKLGIFSWKKGDAVTEAERQHLKNCLETSKRFRMKHFVRPGKTDDDASFLENDRSKYKDLQIICYGSDSFDTHAGYEVDLNNDTVNTGTSKLTTKGDGTLYNKTWKHIFGGLEKKIVFAQENSSHVSMCNDSKLRNICLEALFPDENMRQKIAENVLGMTTNEKK